MTQRALWPNRSPAHLTVLIDASGHPDQPVTGALIDETDHATWLNTEDAEAIADSLVRGSTA